MDIPSLISPFTTETVAPLASRSVKMNLFLMIQMNLFAKQK